MLKWLSHSSQLESLTTPFHLIAHCTWNKDMFQVDLLIQIVYTWDKQPRSDSRDKQIPQTLGQIWTHHFEVCNTEL